MFSSFMLLFLPNFPGPKLIPCPTSIPDSRVFFYVLQEGVESRATQSVRVPVKNLARISPNLNVSLLQEAVGWQFLRTNVFGEDEGFEAASNQRGFQMIRPDNDWFPGLDHLRQEFYNHQWIFGKTPKFKVSSFKLFISSKI